MKPEAKGGQARLHADHPAVSLEHFSHPLGHGRNELLAAGSWILADCPRGGEAEVLKGVIVKTEFLNFRICRNR